MYTLREYQQEAVDEGIAFFKNPESRNSIIVLPTGSGKSLVIASIAGQLEGNTLVFQPRKEILEQNIEKMRGFGFDPSVYSASFNSRSVSKVTLATIGSVKNAAHLFESFNNIIVDECDLVNPKSGMYKDFFSRLNCKILGLTATPYRLSSYMTPEGDRHSILKFITRTRPRVFSNVCYYAQTGDLYRKGFLAKLEYNVTGGFDSAKIKVNSTGADYDDDSLKSYLNEVKNAERCFSAVKTVMDDRRGILVFNKFVEEAQFLQSCIPGSRIVTAKTPARERAEIIENFKTGRIRVVFNVGVLAVGFDYPQLDTVVLARPTMSLALFYQMVGRCIRPHPQKAYGLVVDLCGNVRRFGKIEDLVIHENGGLYFIANKEKQLTNVVFGGNSPVKNVTGPLKMPFGKHKNTPLDEVPAGYLRWVLDNTGVYDPLRSNIEKVLKKGERS